MRILIVDDEPVARQGIRRHLAEETGVEIVGECASGRTALKAICDLAPDLVYLDVQMPGLDGLDVLERLDRECLPALIFTTAFEQYALDAFAFHAVDYLVKPWRRERFAEALNHARLLIEARQTAAGRCDRAAAGPNDRFTVRTGRGVYSFVNLEDIDWIEAADNYVWLHTRHGRHAHRSTIDAIEARLRERSFLRVHRSRIVNLNCVEKVQTRRHGEFEIFLSGGATVISGRTYIAAVRQYLATMPIVQ